VRRGPPDAGPPILLLHGLGGDEDVMWVFETALPRQATVVAPRAPFAANGGHTWAQRSAGEFPSADDFGPAAQAVSDLLAGLRKDIGVGESDWVWMGFSQGAGLAFAAAAHRVAQPIGLASLAGFLPEGTDLGALPRTPVYWGHGIQDREVPIERARRDVTRLRHAGVDVTFCEAEVGHKLGADCLRGLAAWLARLPPGRRVNGET
jgi:predicted esterase